MEKIAIKPYKNVRIHQKVYTDIEKHYCDNYLTKFEETKMSFKKKVRLKVQEDFFKTGVSTCGDKYPDFLIDICDPDSFKEFFETADLNDYCFRINSLLLKNVMDNTLNTSEAVKKEDDRVMIYYHDISYVSINGEHYIDCVMEIKKVFLYCPVCKSYFKRLSTVSKNTKLKESLGTYVYNNKESIKKSYIYKELWYSNKGVHKRYYKDLIVYNKVTNKMYQISNLFISGDDVLKKRNPQKIKIINLKDNFYEYNHTYEDKIFYSLIFLNLKNRFGQTFDYTISDLKMLINQSIENKNSELAKRKEYKLSFSTNCSNNITFLNNNNDITELKNTTSSWTRQSIYDILDFSLTDLQRILFIKETLGINNTLLAILILDNYHSDNRILSKLKNKSQKEIMKYYKMNNKKLHNLMFLREGYRRTYCFFNKYIDDVNNLDKLMKKGGNISIKIDEPQYKDFMFQYIKHNSKERVINQLMKTDTYILHDTIRMFITLRKHNKKYMCNFKLSIQELHDTFSKDEMKISKPNLKIRENKDLIELFDNISVPGIKYSQPLETYELVNVGSYMDICVGGYDEDAATQKCYIVVGYDKNELPVTCIELRKLKKDNPSDKDLFAVRQVKKKFNNRPKEEEADILMKHFIEAEYVINTRDLHNSNLFDESIYKNEPKLSKERVKAVKVRKSKLQNEKYEVKKTKETVVNFRIALPGEIEINEVV